MELESVSVTALTWGSSELSPSVPQRGAQSRGHLVKGLGAVETGWMESPGKRPHFGKCLVIE